MYTEPLITNMLDSLRYKFQKVNEAYSRGQINHIHRDALILQLENEYKKYSGYQIPKGVYYGEWTPANLNIQSNTAQQSYDREQDKVKQTKKEKAEKLRSLIAHYYHR